MHFMEEVELLQEEMEQVLCFLEWQEDCGDKKVLLWVGKV